MRYWECKPWTHAGPRAVCLLANRQQEPHPSLQMAHSAVLVNQAPSQPRASETRAPTPPVAAPGPAPASITQPGATPLPPAHRPSTSFCPPCAMRAGLPSPQLLSRRASPRYRRLDLGVLSINLIHSGTVHSVLDLGGHPLACRHYGLRASPPTPSVVFASPVGIYLPQTRHGRPRAR